MNFFEGQQAAKRKTGYLIVLFTLAVASIVLGVYAVVRLTIGAGQRSVILDQPRFWDPLVFGQVAVGTLAVIVLGSLYKLTALRSGGTAVAELLGGRPVNPDTRDPYERRLLNVVEEMAIAAGMPVPTVYLLEAEEGINAFAAGNTPEDSVVAVTRGCLTLLSRDELQGVVGHELSHVLNGDTRLNVRLMGLTHGILVISLVGRFLLRGLSRAKVRSSGSGKKKGGLGLWLFLLGLGLWLVGAVGVLFARIIKSAVSRQRELLADAAAVQFTRNPPGLAGALKKIGGLTSGSAISNLHAEEASHLFFGDGLGSKARWLFSTHPPLADRIRRLEPAFTGEFPQTPNTPHSLEAEELITRAAAPNLQAPPSLTPSLVVESAGTLSAAHVAYARQLLGSLPAPLRDSARDPWAANALVLALLVAKEPDVRARQLHAIGEREAGLAREVTRLLPLTERCPPPARLPLLDLAMPALHRMSAAQYQALRQAATVLIKADGKVGLFEYTLYRVLLGHLAAQVGAPAEPRKADAMKPLGEEASVLLSSLCHFGTADDAHAARAFEAAAQQLGGTSVRPALVPRSACNLTAFDRALTRLASTGPRLRRAVLAATTAAVLADRTVTVAEAELVRAVAEALACPVPPLLAGLPLPRDGEGARAA